MTAVLVEVHADPAVWLTGPRDPADADEWVAGALAALESDFGLPAGGPETDYLRGVLTAFAGGDLDSPFRFLRMRSPVDAPLVARLDVLPHVDGVDPLLASDEERAWYDHGPQVVELSPELGLRRAVRLYVDDGVRAVVRHHRHVPSPGVDLLLSCVGFDVTSVATGMADLDRLAAAVELPDEAGA